MALAGWRERRVRVSVDVQEFVDGGMNLVGLLTPLRRGG